MPAPRRSPRTFDSPGEAIRDLVGVARRARPLATAYARGSIDPALRERVMVAVSRVNSCRGCTYAHQRWAGRAGVTADDLRAIGMDDLGSLDQRNRAAVAYAVALAEARFRGPIAADLAAGASELLTADELAAIDAVARAMALANLSANTIEGLADSALALLARRRSGGAEGAGGEPRTGWRASRYSALRAITAVTAFTSKANVSASASRRD